MPNRIADTNSLLKLYPDKLVYDLSKHYNLYTRILYHGKRDKMTMMEYVESLGFTYADKITVMKLKDKKSLEQHYPNRIISTISKPSALYQRLSQHAALLDNITIAEYVEQLGFHLATTKEKDKSELSALFPNKKVKCISSYEILYERLRIHAKKEKITVYEYLESLGFTVIP